MSLPRSLVEENRYACGICDREYEREYQARECLEECSPGIRVIDRYRCRVCEAAVAKDGAEGHFCGREALLRAAAAPGQARLPVEGASRSVMPVGAVPAGNGEEK